MEPLVLTDPDQFPSDEVIASHLGRRRALWDALFAFIHAEHPDCTERWRYYNDGKSWLLNVSRKKKTVFWLSVISGTFRITAYFTDKATDAIRASALSDELKTQFETGQHYGKLRAITITFKKKSDLQDAEIPDCPQGLVTRNSLGLRVWNSASALFCTGLKTCATSTQVSFGLMGADPRGRRWRQAPGP